MICRRCLLRINRPSALLSSRQRGISTTPCPAAEATSTKSIEQARPKSSPTTPFTTPLSVSPTGHDEKSTQKKADNPVVLSSVPAGTPLKGLNFLKGKADPVAMEDSEYPAWLWDVLKPRGGAGGDVEDGDLYSKSKVKRQKAKKALKQGKLGGEEVFAKVPLYEQTIDLPAGDGTVESGLQAAQARAELTKAMRGKRRVTIKEANFLRTMG